MLRLLFVLLLGYSFCSSAMGQLLVYPKGMINSRVPQIANVSGGAQGLSRMRGEGGRWEVAR